MSIYILHFVRWYRDQVEDSYAGLHIEPELVSKHANHIPKTHSKRIGRYEEKKKKRRYYETCKFSSTEKKIYELDNSRRVEQRRIQMRLE